MTMKVYDRPLSHSSISLYVECPQKFKFRYIDKIPESPKWFFSFGQSVHSALEFLYSVKALPAPALALVLAHYKENWRKEGYRSPQQEQEHLVEGERILRDFYRKHIDSFRVPLFAEYKFKLEVEGIPVTGYVDRIDKLDNGKLAVIDYKTGKAIKAERVASDPQLTMYQLAVESLLDAEVESLTFYHLPSQTPLTTEPHPQSLVTRLRERIVDVNQDIQAGRFEPAPDEKKCQWCDYRPLCPVFRHMYGAPPPPPMMPAEGTAARAPASGDHDALSALVDRYGDLLARMAETEAQAEQLKEEIGALLRKNGYVRAFGNRFEVSAQPASRWDFTDRTKVLEALRRHGLYDRVLKPSAPEVQRLLESSDLPAAARQELEGVAKRKETPSLTVKPLGA